MVFLSKILLLLILPILTVFPNAISDKCTDFKEKVNDYYDSYVLETYETDNYTFMFVEGVCNGELSYGIFLASIEANAYDIKIFINNSEYLLKEDNRGDTIAYVIQRHDGEVRLCVYDNVNGNSTKRYESALKFNTKESLEMSALCVKGNNLGTSDVTEISRNTGFKRDIINVIIILSSICAICLLWILYLFISKKGMFNKNNKHASEVNFFVYEEEENTYYDYNNEVEAEVVEEKTVEINQEEVYEKKYYYEEDIEEFNLKPYLQEKGFKEDYALMNEEEKNQVMILLMTLKYNGTINEIQYKDEVIKLWKK